MATVFVSPGIYTREQDFTAFVSRIGTTKLGVVGKFPKGPAFEATKIKNADDYVFRFGQTHHDYPATYVASAFLTQSDELYISRVLGKNGFTNSAAWLLVADFSANTTAGQYSGATLAVIRSKQLSTGVEYFDEETDLILGNWESVSGSPLSSFVLSATTGPLTAETAGITVSLDETRADYIAKVLGKNPKVISGTHNIYVESVFPHFIREAANRGDISGIYPKLVYVDSVDFTNYATSYTNATTPWIVSRVNGGTVKNLFKVHTRSDGDSSNREVKISIRNIDVNNNLFDLVVRNYADNDASSFNVIDSYTRLSLDEDSPRYVARVIGCVGDDPFPRRSDFIEIEMAESFPKDTVPAGFRGYSLRSHVDSGTGSDITITPQLYYKHQYLSGDTITKTYLGLSELAYTSITKSQVGVRNAAQNIEHDLFVFQGAIGTGVTTTNGFHMESGAPTGFTTGVYSSLTGYTDSNGELDRKQLKFTVLPAGGFDGFNKYRTYTNLYEEFAVGETNNIQAFKDAIDEFQSSEEIDINIITTPGIDFENNEELVKYALEMTEERADMIYIMDSPRVTVGATKGTPSQVVSRLENTDIDSSYAATYWPWLQVEDTITRRYVWMSPTFAVARALAFTDNKYQAWFAPAGALRGVVPSNVKRADVKLDNSDRDVLYAGRINPIIDSTQTGILIWGNKTLQVQETALDRINVRRLMLRIERMVAAASLTLVFEQNDPVLRDQFLAKVEPILIQIQNQRGIAAFRVVMDESNNSNETIDRNTLVGKIQIQPVRAAEFLDLTFQLLPTGANFDEF